jgi:hypothetical protein
MTLWMIHMYVISLKECFERDEGYANTRSIQGKSTWLLHTVPAEGVRHAQSTN